MKKLLALLLAASFVFVAAACGSSPSDSASVTTTNVNETTEAETEFDFYDLLPNEKYDGYKFVILTRDAQHHTKEVYSTQITGEVVNDTVFERNSRVEEHFNIKIEPFEVSESNELILTQTISKTVMADEAAFDLALAHTVNAGSVALEGVLYNWNDMPYNDFTRDWWNTSVAEELNFQNHLFLAVSDMCISAVDYTWVLVFNKKLQEEYNIGSIYEDVNKKNWTIDRFNEVIKAFSNDVNGDGKYGLEDLYGFSTHFNSAVNNWMFALDQKVTAMGDDGYPVLCSNTPKMISIVEKMYDILYNGNSSMYFSDAVVGKTGASTNLGNVTGAFAAAHDSALANFFSEGHTFIAALRLYVIELLRSMETDFGIIPFPMWDSNQEGYYTHVDGHAPLMCLPLTLVDPERASAIIEALSYESYRLVMPAVYDIVLESKYARDEESAEMLDIILEGRTYTFGYIYDSWKGMQWALTNLMNSKKTDFASHYAKTEKSAQKHLDSVIKAFESVID